MNAAVVVAFGATLLVAVLVSGLAQRSVLSTAVLFLLAGFVFGPGALGVVVVDTGRPVLETFTELALFAVLYTEGMQVDARELRRAWRLPGRALLLGMPLTMLILAGLARGLVGLDSTDAFLLGAALSPTDPVFAAALVSNEGIPRRLRRLLNVESGMNDGLALPVVVAVLAVVSPGSGDPVPSLLALPLGVAIGLSIAWLAIRLERSRFFAAAPLYVPLNGVAIAVLVFGVAKLLHGNEFLAAFAAGGLVGAASPALHEAFAPFGDVATELLKLAAVLLLGALVTPSFVGEVSWRGLVFAALALLAVRPLALAAALAGSGLSWREWGAAAWFGPRGFASVFYGLLVLQSGIPNASRLFHLIAIVVAASIVAHSSTDVVIARRLQPRTAGARSARSAP